MNTEAKKENLGHTGGTEVCLFYTCWFDIIQMKIMIYSPELKKHTPE